MSVSPRVQSPAAAGAALEPRDTGKRRREDDLDRDPAVRARQITGAFANAERLRYAEGPQRTMVEAIRARHKAKGRKIGKPKYEEVMKECHATTLFSMFSRSKRDREAVNTMVEMLMHLHSPGTTNAYSGAWLRFIKWCTKVDKSCPMPAEPETVMRYLVYLYKVAREKNTTSASTKTALCAINSFHEQYRMPNPCHAYYVKMLLKSSKRALGMRGTQKKALLDKDMERLYARFVAPDPTDVGNLAMMLRMAICQEGLLRYDELSGITFADIVITEVALLVFFTESKTEKERKGLWVTIHRDEAPWKAYKLLPALVHAMQKQFAHMHKFGWARNKFASLVATEPDTGAVYLAMNELPLMTRFQAVFPKWRVKNRPKIFVPSLKGEKVSYNSFSKQIKTWVAAIGYNPEDFATHSLRRGGTSMLRMTGLSDAQIMSAGRWKTLTVMKDYVDWEVDLALRVRAARLASRA